MRSAALPARRPSRSRHRVPAPRGWPTLACAAGLACLLALPPGANASAPPDAKASAPPGAKGTASLGSSADATPAALRSRIQALVGTAACSTDADCRTSALGAKACGGPEAYIAWSARSTDEAALSRAVADYNAAQQATNLREGRVSNCELVTDPGAVCVATGTAGGSCQLRQRPRGHGGQSSR
jgi:hypothetical protein